MLITLRRETIKFGRDFAYQLRAGVESWKRSGVGFKMVSLVLAIFFVLAGVVMTLWHIWNGHEPPRGTEVVLYFLSIQLARLIGKNQGWL